MKATGELRERITAALGDLESQQILSLVFQEPKTSSAISTDLGLPISTVYRKVGQMRECGLVMIERFLVGPDGKREAVYACAFTEIRLRPEPKGFGIEITFSQRALERRWFELFYSRAGQGPDWQP